MGVEAGPFYSFFVGTYYRVERQCSAHQTVAQPAADGVRGGESSPRQRCLSLKKCDALSPDARRLRPSALASKLPDLLAAPAKHTTARPLKSSAFAGSCDCSRNGAREAAGCNLRLIKNLTDLSTHPPAATRITSNGLLERNWAARFSLEITRSRIERAYVGSGPARRNRLPSAWRQFAAAGFLTLRISCIHQPPV